MHSNTKIIYNQFQYQNRYFDNELNNGYSKKVKTQITFNVMSTHLRFF